MQGGSRTAPTKASRKRFPRSQDDGLHLRIHVGAVREPPVRQAQQGNILLPSPASGEGQGEGTPTPHLPIRRSASNQLALTRCLRRDRADALRRVVERRVDRAAHLV